jgi:amino-acid N-acetyltransferase
LGIYDGVDYLHSGAVRRVDAEGIVSVLDNDAIALVSPLGYSPAGALFSVSASEVAEAVAVAIGADKLLFLDRYDGLMAADGQLIRQCTVAAAEKATPRRRLSRL